MRIGDEKVALLRGIQPLERLPERELDALAALFEERMIEAGHVLVSEGANSADVIIVAQGIAVVMVRGRAVAKAGPGDVLSELHLSDTGQRSATVSAETSMRLLVTDPHRFASLAEHPGISLMIARSLARRIRLLNGAFAKPASKR